MRPRSSRLQGSSRDRDSHSRISVLRKTSVEAVGDAGEDHARLEEEQPLDVERALVVEQRAPAAEDELRHDHDRDRVRVGGEPAQVGEERVAEVAEGRLLDLERDGASPCASHSRRSRSASSASNAKKTARVSASPSVARVVDRTHRGGVDAGDEDAADARAAAARSVPPLRAAGTSVTTTPGSLQQAQLQRERRAPQRLEQRRAAGTAPGRSTVTKFDSPRGSAQR